ncbi:hypothetical protein [Cellulomonas sp. Leaf334]|uniref:hypothetical protein n=1 Tax=Cellulomonas sp. Leaf334 TaxID=1736339 RepID=UPI00070044CC|nr:hypothetical protein [Cellulomonas sp. Leaf334]KQR07676.1 hypothetical protein ASF78_20580 [Cellulomonas sp. Leaf334]
MIPKETSASIELPVAADAAWLALTRAAGGQDHLFRFEHTDVVLDSVTPGEAAGGDGRWEELDFRVAVHLVPMGAERTLVLFTAEATQEPHGVRSTAHASAAHRRARRDLEAMALAVGQQVTDATG